MTITENVLVDINIADPERKVCITRDYLAPEQQKNVFARSDNASEIYCIGLLALEVAGITNSDRLAKIEDQAQYDQYLHSLIKAFADGGKSEKSCNMISEMLCKQPSKRLEKSRKNLRLEPSLMKANEILSQLAQLQHPLYAHSMLKTLGSSTLAETEKEIATIIIPKKKVLNASKIEEVKQEQHTNKHKFSQIKILEDTSLDNNMQTHTDLIDARQVAYLEIEYSKKLAYERDRYTKLVDELQIKLLIILEKFYKKKYTRTAKITTRELYSRLSHAYFRLDFEKYDI